MAANDTSAETRLPDAKSLEPKRLKDAVREARIEAAERSGVVVDLRDADVARLELLDEALNPVFAEVPSEIDLFDRGISRGETPKLWIDVVAHVEMGRDKRIYRFVQDTRFGRKVLAESYEIRDLVEAVTRYVARRLVEREHALAADSAASPAKGRGTDSVAGPHRSWWMFGLGILCGIGLLFAFAWLSMPY
ncbi:MAG TPA: hypothetical protein VNQ56_06135 [Pseudolabrys sp.]|nr:hypothetical protein [Pseudolabrys sp.]